MVGSGHALRPALARGLVMSTVFTDSRCNGERNLESVLAAEGAPVERGRLPRPSADPLEERLIELRDRSGHDAADDLAGPGEGAGGDPGALKPLLAGRFRVLRNRTLLQRAHAGEPPVDGRARLGVPRLAGGGEPLQSAECLVVCRPPGRKLFRCLAALERSTRTGCAKLRSDLGLPAGELGRSARDGEECATGPGRRGPQTPTAASPSRGTDGRQSKKPAATYSPARFPAEYHRLWRA
jgi:hypothetical protein